MCLYKIASTIKQTYNYMETSTYQNALNKLHTTTNRTFIDGNILYWEYEWLQDFLHQFNKDSVNTLKMLISRLNLYVESGDVADLANGYSIHFKDTTLGDIFFIEGDTDSTQLVYCFADSKIRICNPNFETEAIVVNPEKLSIYLGYLLSIFTFGKFNEQTVFFEHIKQ